MEMMMDKHRYIAKSFAHRYVPDEADHFLISMASDIQQLRELLRNRESTEFVPVVNAEGMSIYETEMLLQALDAGSIPVNSVIVNRLVAASVGEDGTVCPFCQARARDQAPYKREIEMKFSAYDLVCMPLFPTEIRGLAALSAYADMLFCENPAGRQAPAALAVANDVEPAREEVANQAGLADLLGQELQFILFGGKGGVGKTTVAAATALELARRNPATKTLIFSTDPTSSLADSLALSLIHISEPTRPY